jgi:uncharacterized protein YndB with AHSA1/START domain
MSQPVQLEVFYPHPPERVWRVLTDRRALASWMMENDFEPKLGHQFHFYNQPLPGLKTAIQCKVVELEEPTRLVYTWKESPTAEPSLVIWTLTTVTGGTQLRLKHHQYSYTTAVATANNSGGIYQQFGLFHSARFPDALGVSMSSGQFIDQSRTHFPTSGRATTLDVPLPQAFNWDYYFNQRLPKLLAQEEPAPN